MKTTVIKDDLPRSQKQSEWAKFFLALLCCGVLDQEQKHSDIAPSDKARPAAPLSRLSDSQDASDASTSRSSTFSSTGSLASSRRTTVSTVSVSISQDQSRGSSSSVTNTMPSPSVVLLHPIAAVISPGDNRGRRAASVGAHPRLWHRRSRTLSLPEYRPPGDRSLVRTGQFQNHRDLAIMRGGSVPPLYTLHRPPPLDLSGQYQKVQKVQSEADAEAKRKLIEPPVGPSLHART